mgnify:CR=1 FL=1
MSPLLNAPMLIAIAMLITYWVMMIAISALLEALTDIDLVVWLVLSLVCTLVAWGIYLGFNP